MGRAWPILIILGFCQFCASWGSLALIAVQIEMRAGLGITAAGISALIWAFSFSLAFGAPIAQALIGHWQRRTVLLASLILLAVGAIGLGVAQDWEQAMAARILMALGAASVMPTASVIAASIVSEEHRPAAMSVVFGGLTASIVIAMPISSAVGEALGWRATWFTAGIAALSAVLAVAFGVRSDVRGTRASFAAMWAVLSKPATGLTIATTACLLCGGFLTYSMIAFWFVEVGGAPRSAFTIALFMSGIASMIGNAFSYQIVRALGREGAIIAGLSFTVFCFLVLWAAPQIYLVSYPAFVCFGVGWALCLAPLQARLMETAGPLAQLALALNASAFFGGQGLGAMGGGFVYETFGPATLPLASMIILGITTVMFALSRKVSLQPIGQVSDKQ